MDSLLDQALSSDFGEGTSSNNQDGTGYIAQLLGQGLTAWTDVTKTKISTDSAKAQSANNASLLNAQNSQLSANLSQNQKIMLYAGGGILVLAVLFLVLKK